MKDKTNESSTRTLKIGAKTVTISNVPNSITNDELYRYALLKLFEIGSQNVGIGG